MKRCRKRCKKVKIKNENNDEWRVSGPGKKGQNERCSKDPYGKMKPKLYINIIYFVISNYK